jgi:hypothetical protein
MKEEVRQSLMEQWIYHAGKCDDCQGFPSLCKRGTYLHKRLWPEDWSDLSTKTQQAYNLTLEKK